MKKQSDAKERILETASRLFQKQGYHATGLNQIIKESGAPKGSLYYYFPNGKEQLAIEAVQITEEEISAQLQHSLNSHSDHVKAIQAVFQYIEDQFQHLDEIKGVPIGLIAMETWSVSEELRLTCQYAFEGWQALFSNKLQSGGISKDRADDFAVTISSLIEGALTVSVTSKDPKPLTIAKRQIPLLLRD
ncbi:TetR/AcrR family transcriptional regulator [Evansella halocellulosilytica]|uniref:TetR/AcrR family transcriptional regulator n=1 Tax=Evansella halocellulosilytica TaxID=2011013 RepID=UPI000BB9334D|nr:TetR/AcrR family transcriptional regulator [Evansella halocellulosilytica]